MPVPVFKQHSAFRRNQIIVPLAKLHACMLHCDVRNLKCLVEAEILKYSYKLNLFLGTERLANFHFLISLSSRIISSLLITNILIILQFDLTLI